MSDVQQPTITVVLPSWYTYKNVNGFLVFDAIVQSATQPPNSSQWAPHVLPAGMTSYFDGTNWVVGIDINKATFATLQTLALRQAHQAFSYAVSNLSSGYSQLEQRSWRTQVTDATALLAVANATPSAMLSALAKARGIDARVLAQSIVTKSDTYNAGYIVALASFQAVRDQINAAKTPADLPAFTSPPVPTLGG